MFKERGRPDKKDAAEQGKGVFKLARERESTELNASPANMVGQF